MRWGHIELMCADTAATERFYAALGFDIVARQPGGFTWMEVTRSEILLRPGLPQEVASEYASAPSAMVLYVDDVDETMDRLGALGVEVLGDDGTGCPLVRDPDGRWLQITNPEAHG